MELANAVSLRGYTQKSRCTFCTAALILRNLYYVFTAAGRPFWPPVPEWRRGQDGPEYTLDTRTQQISDTKSQIFLFHAVMVYGAVVLMVICFTILSLQQLWDANQYRYRFGVLRKLGVEDRSIHHLISKQLALWFGLPVGLAVLISGAISAFFFWSIATEINAYLGFDALLSQVSALAGILLLLLLAYALSTWTLFRRAVSP